MQNKGEHCVRQREREDIQLVNNRVTRFIDYSRGTSAHAHEALPIHLHKLCAYKLYLCHRGVEETNNLSKGFMG